MDNNSISEVQKLLEQAYQKLEEENKALDNKKLEYQQMTKKLDDFHVGNKVVLDIGL